MSAQEPEHLANSPSTRTPQSTSKQRRVHFMLDSNKENILVQATPESQKKVTPSRLRCIGELEEELTCAICLSISVRPCTTPCGHSFCRRCLKQLLQHDPQQRCPKCRTVLPPGLPITINTVMWNTIQLLFPRQTADAPESPAVAELCQSLQAANRGAQPLSRFHAGRAAQPRSSARLHETEAVPRQLLNGGIVPPADAARIMRRRRAVIEARRLASVHLRAVLGDGAVLGEGGHSSQTDAAEASAADDIELPPLHSDRDVEISFQDGPFGSQAADPAALYGAAPTAGTAGSASLLLTRMRQIQRSSQPGGAGAQVRAARYSSGLRQPARQTASQPAAPQPVTSLQDELDRLQMDPGPGLPAEAATWMTDAASRGGVSGRGTEGSSVSASISNTARQRLRVLGVPPDSPSRGPSTAHSAAQQARTRPEAAAENEAGGSQRAVNPFIRRPASQAGFSALDRSQVPVNEHGSHLDRLAGLRSRMAGTAVAQPDAASSTAQPPASQPSGPSGGDGSLAAQLAAQIEGPQPVATRGPQSAERPSHAGHEVLDWSQELQIAEHLEAPIHSLSPAWFNDDDSEAELDLSSDLEILSDSDEEGASSVVSLVDLTQALEQLGVHDHVSEVQRAGGPAAASTAGAVSGIAAAGNPRLAEMFGFSAGPHSDSDEQVLSRLAGTAGGPAAVELPETASIWAASSVESTEGGSAQLHIRRSDSVEWLPMAEAAGAGATPEQAAQRGGRYNLRAQRGRPQARVVAGLRRQAQPG